MSRRRAAVLSAMLSTLLGLACIHQPPDPGAAVGPRTSGDPSLFSYEPAPMEVETGPSDFPALAGVPIVRIAFAGYFHPDEPGRRVVAHWYRAPGNAPRPGVIVLPILGGDYDVSILFAEFLAKEGFHVLAFERKADFLRPGTDLTAQQEVIREGVIDVRRAIDWWATQPGVDGRRLGLVGISAGGIGGALVLASEPRLAAGALLISGCGLADLLAKLKEIEIVQFRDALCQANGWSREEFRVRAHAAFDLVDPEFHAGRIDPRKMLLISAIFDRVVSYPHSDRLYRAMNRPARVLIPTGHYSSVLFLPVIKGELRDHFRRRLGA